MKTHVSEVHAQGSGSFWVRNKNTFSYNINERSMLLDIQKNDSLQDKTTMN